MPRNRRIRPSSMPRWAAFLPEMCIRDRYQALQIAKGYPDVNRDILIASCLLHDIGRMKQFQNPQLCHAEEGGKMAYEFMRSLGWNEKDCKHIQECITTHRFRTDRQPESIEAKILFDADKLDVTGALGISRTLLYKGRAGEPLSLIHILLISIFTSVPKRFYLFFPDIRKNSMVLWRKNGGCLCFV